AVLAHEIGHLEQRHGLRRVLQDSATALVVIAVTGDIGSLVSLTAALPALVLQSKYSRDFETEADDFARAYLARRGIPVDALTAILLRMEQKAGRSNSAPDYLSSHPATRERVERARAPR
ncbi:MAG: M48 family metallopeptidase, partial [Rhodocyclales bacterium]|nr:M48 family metallopeptidase [Rhodocyclales bacterium]